MATDPLAGGQGEGSATDASTAVVPNAGMDSTTQNDKGKPDLTKYVPVEDLRRMQSTYDQKLAAQGKQYTELQKQFQELQAWREKNETEGLTEEELSAYMAQKAEYEAGQKIAEVQRQAAQLEYERNKLTLRTYYMNKGAPESIFASDEPADWQEAFLSYLADKAQKAEAALAKAQKGQQQPGAPTVTIHKPAAGSLGKIKFNDLRLGSKEQAEVFAKLDAGMLKPEDIDFS